MAVSILENLTRVSRENQVRHLNTTLEAHQKFATLSSKSPRENGKILVMGSRMAESGAKGGSHGRNSKINDAEVTRPSWTNNRDLRTPMEDVKESVEYGKWVGNAYPSFRPR